MSSLQGAGREDRVGGRGIGRGGKELGFKRMAAGWGQISGGEMAGSSARGLNK